MSFHCDFLPENIFTVSVDFRLVSYSFICLIFYCHFIWISLDFLLMRLNRFFSIWRMARTTRCKSTHKTCWQKTETLAFSPTLVVESLKLTKLTGLESTQFFIMTTSQTFKMTSRPTKKLGILESIIIASRPSILPYNDAIKWIVEHTNPKDRSFNDSVGS